MVASEAKLDLSLSVTLAGSQGDVWKGGWFVLEISSHVLALQSLFHHSVESRGRELASALSLVLFCSAVQ